MRSTGVLLGLILLALSSDASNATEVNRIVLRVNSEIVTLADYEKRRDERLDAVRRGDMPEEQRQALLASIGIDTMQEIFREAIMVSRGDQLGIRPGSEEIDAMVAETRRTMDMEDDERFRMGLAASGMTVEDFRQQMRTSAIVREVIGREVRPRVRLEEEDLRRFYQDNLDLFRTPLALEVQEVVVLEDAGRDVGEMTQTANELRSAVLAGADLVEALREAADKGWTTGLINLGWVERGDLDEEIEAAILDLPEGQVSLPVAGRGGLHVVQVRSRREPGLRPLSEAVDRIREHLGQQRMSEEMQKYMGELAQQAHVVSRPPADAAGFDPRAEAGSEPVLSGWSALATEPELVVDSPDPPAATVPEVVQDQR